MARRKSSKSTRSIESYQHSDQERLNNPPVGLVTPDTDPDAGQQQTYAYDPHLDPQLSWDQQSGRKEIEERYAHLRAVLSAADAANTALRNAEKENASSEQLASLRAEVDQLVEVAKEAAVALEKPQLPYLNWAGKAEHTSFEVPTASLHVHERIDPRTIVEAVRRHPDPATPIQLSLFQTPQENPPIRQAIEFYRHKHGWSNRLVAGDSLLVMNSLLEKEGLGGQVQMIYIDPPYGIKYGSNFQPFVNKRDVKDGKDEDLTAEPEQIRAFRDTWELGIHSYLSYLRDRLLLARELLAESGSVFVQISDENVHHVREVMDEVFGVGNFIMEIRFQCRTTEFTKFIPTLYDYLLWYGKDKETTKCHQLFYERPIELARKVFNYVELSNGTVRPISKQEVSGEEALPSDARLFKAAQFPEKPEEQDRIIKAGRMIQISGNQYFKRYDDDFPLLKYTNHWDDTVWSTFSGGKLYVVQTHEKAIARCLLMTTDPGDLVFDPTCGSGTTAYVAEHWGRRWITCDTSRVALTLARTRLMTAVYDYYELAHPQEGVGSGFNYKTVPHVTLGSIAKDEPSATETLYDQPAVNRKITRVSGPFTVEAVPAPAVRSPDELLADVGAGLAPAPADTSVARSGETLRQAEWRDELLKTGLRGKAGQHIRFARLEPLPGCRWLHADGETHPSAEGADSVREDAPAYNPMRAVVSFGPEHAPLEQRQVASALEEAQTLVPKPKLIIFAAFQFDPEASKDIDETNWPGVTLLKAQMNADLLTDDLKKKRASNESFWLIGQPDVQVERIAKGADQGKVCVSVHGFDYYNTRTGNIESGGADKVAVWLLDTDYDGRSLYPRQVFFPLAGPKEGWARLARNLKAEIDPDLIEAYRGTVSLPFKPGKHRRIAVKIVDDRGIESLKVVEVD